ncbi:fez family zinc finger protein 2-like [Physella acuta]|uniref:fez family zinc finger protein 2-like n=1 Tax=Physella acuta TaxID=109671 RepID=UPI0027DBB30A|nr:fez family zinc finger protein 2-like [Physella acuta]
MMSVVEGHMAAYSQGPLRPIPIHLPRPAGLDFRIPANIPSEKTVKPRPALWNPALDLSPSSRTGRDVSDPETHSKKRATPTSKPTEVTTPTTSAPPIKVTPPPMPPLTTVGGLKDPMALVSKEPRLMGSPMPPLTTVGGLKDPMMLTSKDPHLMGSSMFEHLHRQLPGNMENQLSILASKEVFFSTLFANPGGLPPHPSQLTPSPHPHPFISLSERQISLQNALAIAHAKAVMERLSSSPSQAPHPPRHHPNHLQHHHQQQQQRPQPQQNQQAPIPERAPTLQNALAIAQSRALIERVNSSQILSPAMDGHPNHHYGRKLFPCPQCRYTTDRRNNLKRHMLTMHQTSSKMLECCGVLFNTKASLREHALIYHYHGYTCCFCGRRFCRKALLKRHLSVHNGQKDFVCNVCDYATSHKSNLERHRKVHSRQEDGKDGEDETRYHDDDTRHYQDDVKSNGSEAVSHDDASSDELSVCSDYDDDDDTDVEINVHSD